MWTDAASAYLCRMDAIYTLEQLDKVVQLLWREGKKHKTWAFYAPMGAGKTTLIHTLCKQLQVPKQASSPTFAIISEYASEVAGGIYHMDWYRLKSEEEAIQAGVEDALTSGFYCFVEWPEKAEALLPEDTLVIHIEVLDAHTRRLFTGQPEESE
jgi:tRNA threonylcarbamoyladenosine biosynthesis protein TsaE